jgi:uroporphyrinogen-III synthase
LGNLLTNKFILVTKETENSSEFAGLLEGEGGEVINFPTIKIIPVKDYSNLDDTFRNFSQFDYLILSSTNACKYFQSRMKSLNINLDFSKVKVITTGEKTALYCKELDIPVDYIPENYCANGIIKLLSEKEIKNKKILIPSSVIARDELKEGLENLGAEVHSIQSYDVIKPDEKDLANELKIIKERIPDIYVFTSPSTFNNFLKIMNISGEYFNNKTICAIGPTTATLIKQNGLNVDIIPKKFTLIHLAYEIINYFKEKETAS